MTQDNGKGQWGGSRSGAGNPEFKPKWKSGKTTVIRVPEAIADEVLAVARQIDSGEPVTQSSEPSAVDAAKLLNQLKPYLHKRAKLSISELEDMIEASLADH